YPRVSPCISEEHPIMWVSLIGKDPEVLTEMAEDDIVPFLERQEGVSLVTFEGGKECEIQLILDEATLEQYGVSTETLIETINGTNESTSVGTINKGSKDF